MAYCRVKGMHFSSKNFVNAAHYLCGEFSGALWSYSGGTTFPITGSFRCKPTRRLSMYRNSSRFRKRCNKRYYLDILVHRLVDYRPSLATIAPSGFDRHSSFHRYHPTCPHVDHGEPDSNHSCFTILRSLSRYVTITVCNFY